MRLAAADGSEIWLAYGMNVHPGGTVESTARALREAVLPLRDRLGARGRFGVALRLDGGAVHALHADAGARARLADLFHAHDLVPFTANGFVVGAFHGEPVKASVYRPTWAEPERLAYTTSLADVMAAWCGPGQTRSISTAPGSWRAWGSGPEVDRACAENLVRAGRHLADLEERTARRVLLGLEPEPGCTVQTTAEAIRFFEGPLQEAARGDDRALAHLGVCYDVCHQAVVGEDVDASLQALARAGVPVVKVQASSALEVEDPGDPAARAALAAFDEPVYLHQVGAQGPGLHVAPDLPDALGDPAWTGRRPWRVHFHVPVFRAEAIPPLRTTRPLLERALAAVAAGGVTAHLETETYTWDVIPEAERRAGSGFDLVEALARELEWVLGVLEAHGVRREPVGGRA